MSVRLVVLTEIIAPYRIPVFNALASNPDIDLHVIFLAENDPVNRQWRIYSEEIRFSFEVLPSWRARLGEHNLLINKNVSRNLQNFAPDVVLCGGYNYFASWQAQRWAKGAGIPFLLWCESTASDQRSSKLWVESLKQTFFAKCDGFVVPGTSSRQYVEKMGAAAYEIFIAPNAVDNELFASCARAARANPELRRQLGLPLRYFLYVGRLVPSKGVLDLLQAYAGLSGPLRSGIGLVIVGDGPARAELESFARAISSGAIHFPGFVHRDELAAYYSFAESFVFPTHSDPWGLVVNEAMACGLPVICSSVAGCAADLVRDNGRTVAPQNPAALSRSMERIASDPRLRELMSLHSLRLIQDYSPRRCATGIAQAALAAHRNSAAKYELELSTAATRSMTMEV